MKVSSVRFWRQMGSTEFEVEFVGEKSQVWTIGEHVMRSDKEGSCAGSIFTSLKISSDVCCQVCRFSLVGGSACANLCNGSSGACRLYFSA